MFEVLSSEIVRKLESTFQAPIEKRAGDGSDFVSVMVTATFPCVGLLPELYRTLAGRLGKETRRNSEEPAAAFTGTVTTRTLGAVQCRE